MKKLVLTMGLVSVLLAAATPPVLADLIPVDLTLVPPSAQVNTLELTITAEALGMTFGDSDTATLTGNALVELTINFQPVTFEADTVGLEFTGGRFAVSNVSFSLDFSLFGEVQATGTGIAGTLDTLAPPGLVVGGAFAGSDHVAILNEGTVYAYGTGIVGGLFDPLTVNLSVDPIAAPGAQQGSLLVSSPVIAGPLATYDVTLTQPVELDQELFRDTDFVVTATGSGVLQATGQFVIPKPVLPGDANLDGKVDGGDYTLWADHYGECGVGLPEGDFTGEGCVDGADYTIWADNYGTGTAAIPEPATLSLLALGACLPILRRRT